MAVQITSVTCNHCGAPLEVPEGKASEYQDAERAYLRQREMLMRSDREPVTRSGRAPD